VQSGFHLTVRNRLVNSRSVKVLFFSPFANIWEHSFPEALVAETFAAESLDVVAVRCDGMLQVYCVAMSAAGIGPDASLKTRLQVCSACTKRRDLLSSAMNIPAVVMDEWVDEGIRSRVDELVAGVTNKTWTSLEVDGVPLGRYAAYETWLSNKLVSADLADEIWRVYQGQLRNTLLTFFAGQRILATEKPDAVIVYNDHYSVNHAFCAAAQLAGIPTYTIHGGSHIVRRAETLSIFASGHTLEDIFQSAAWLEYESQPIGPAEVDMVGGHISGLLAANSAFAYSSEFKGTSPTRLRESLGIAPGSAVMLATMSSEDELMGVRLIDAVPTNITQKSLFANQFEWVDYLFGYAKSHPSTHLVLRLHPRMFPNKREGVLSPVVSRIMALRDTAPSNVSFNLPADGIGLYDLMQVVDVLLNYSSSVGAELAALGIPVVVPSNAQFYTYPGQINRTGHTVAEYSEHIARALAEGWSLENSRNAFRWFAFLFGRIAVDFSDAVTSQPIAARPKKPGFRLWLWRKLAWVFLQHGPLIRERLSLRNRGVSARSRDVLVDVVVNRRESASDSPVWPPIDSSVQSESALLERYLLGLCDSLWSDIQEPDSLAGRIRACLAPAVATR
jgi:hypothetical protein